MRCFKALLIFCIVLSGSGCDRKSDPDVLARVGDAELTRKDAMDVLDTTAGSADAQLGRIVNAWVNTELIYQEAKRQGVEDSEEFKRTLNDARKQIANQTFLEQYLASDSASITESTLRDYFKAHSEEFPLHEDMIKLNLVGLKSRERASAFAASVSQGVSWKSAMAGLRRESAEVTSSITESYVTQKTLFPAELWKVASGLAMHEVSIPVRTSQGYIVVQSLGMAKQGKPASFDLARDEVRQRVEIELGRKRYEDLLGTLRQQYDVQILYSTRPTDTSHASHE